MSRVSKETVFFNIPCLKMDCLDRDSQAWGVDIKEHNIQGAADFFQAHFQVPMGKLCPKRGSTLLLGLLYLPALLY